MGERRSDVAQHTRLHTVHPGFHTRKMGQVGSSGLPVPGLTALPHAVARYTAGSDQAPERPGEEAKLPVVLQNESQETGCRDHEWANCNVSAVPWLLVHIHPLNPFVRVSLVHQQYSRPPSQSRDSKRYGNRYG